ncbi:MAG: copper transporter [Actinomycetota bacterium]
MVSFRYLLVTIVSIFVALGLGVAAGTAVINQRVVHTLENNERDLRRTNDELGRELRASGDFLDALVPRILQGRLAHREVVLIRDANADGGAVGAARDFLADAGASIVGELTVTSRIASDDPAGSGLTTLTGVSGGPEVVAAAAARLLADRLEAGPPSTAPGAPDDLLKGLLDGGFLLPQGALDLSRIGGTKQSVVVVAGGKTDPAVPFSQFVLPLIEQLLQDGVPVAAGQPAQADRGFVGLLHEDPVIASEPGMVTVDNLAPDTPFGGVALVLALKDLLITGHGGAYGDDEPALVPQLP